MSKPARQSDPDAGKIARQCPACDWRCQVEYPRGTILWVAVEQADKELGAHVTASHLVISYEP